MEVTLLGTGSPVPLINRAGTSILVESKGDRILIDCGPGSLRRLLEQDVNPGTVDTLLFSHHHIDHNADFYNFVITNWTRGNGELDIYGPEPWTSSLVDSIYSIYEEDLQYRKRVSDVGDLIWELDPKPVTDDFYLETETFVITAMRVDHSIETYGFKIVDKHTTGTFVFSGDSRKIPELSSFADGADVLVMDSALAPRSETLPTRGEEYIWERYTDPLPERMWKVLRQTHCDPTEAGEIARDAGVTNLILTHLLPYRDPARTKTQAAETFDGEIRVAEDGLTFTVSDEVTFTK